ncbi:MAG: recombinase RecB [Richelia sp. RM1_1_1]|nr:recombinase RecB [Richelia sp. RM1_1_1]
MLSGAALRKTGIGWEFASELTLEDFVWENLPQLFELTPLKRQHPAKGEYCDILAVNNKKQLTIIELKNTEDRYLVQQLTRYYDNLVDEKPFTEQIDYNQLITLVGIAPSFHRHNHIDRKYNQLKIDFLELAVSQNDKEFYLNLKDINTAEIWSISIPYQEIDFSSLPQDIPEPPQKLLDWLGSCSGEEQLAIIKMREKILSFDKRIKETVEGRNTIRYGKGKTKVIAEICYQQSNSKPIIFLWLPTPTSRQKEVIGRLRLWLDGSKVTHVGHITSGFGRMKLQWEWDAMPRDKRPKHMFHSGSPKSFTPVPIFQGYNNTPNTLEALVDLALTKWLHKIQ